MPGLLLGASPITWSKLGHQAILVENTILPLHELEFHATDRAGIGLLRRRPCERLRRLDVALATQVGVDHEHLHIKVRLRLRRERLDGLENLHDLVTTELQSQQLHPGRCPGRVKLRGAREAPLESRRRGRPTAGWLAALEARDGQVRLREGGVTEVICGGLGPVVIAGRELLGELKQIDPRRIQPRIELPGELRDRESGTAHNRRRRGLPSTRPCLSHVHRGGHPFAVKGVDHQARREPGDREMHLDLMGPRLQVNVAMGILLRPTLLKIVVEHQVAIDVETVLVVCRDLEIQAVCRVRDGRREATDTLATRGVPDPDAASELDEHMRWIHGLNSITASERGSKIR